jgi:hypothetical protein
LFIAEISRVIKPPSVVIAATCLFSALEVQGCGNPGGHM